MYFGCDLSIEEYTKDFEKLGYTHEESIELAKLAIRPVTINTEIDWDELDKLVEAFNAIGCTSFNQISLGKVNVVNEDGAVVATTDFTDKSKNLEVWKAAGLQEEDFYNN